MSEWVRSGTVMVWMNKWMNEWVISGTVMVWMNKW